MNRAVLAAVIFLFALFPSLEGKEINMLFIGNSFTARHDIPKLVKEVFEEGQPDLTVNVEKVIYGGQDQFRHHDLYHSGNFVRFNSITVPEIEKSKAAIQQLMELEEAPPFYTAYWEKTGLKPQPWEKVKKLLSIALKKQDALIRRIKNKQRIKWDYVVLQSWRDVVPNVDQGYGEYAQKMAKLAKEEGAEVILYVPAPHAQNEKPVTEPVKPAQTKMELDTVKKLAERIEPFAVVPVGLGIEKLQQGGTDLQFRYVNDFHPNQYTAFLAANMFYAAFFKESPEGFKFNTVVENISKGKGEGKDPDGGDAKVVFEELVKSLLQKTAYDAAMEYASKE